jgi:hypothetical protein
MSNASYYNWKAKYSGLTVSDLRRLKALEDENRRLKQIVADQALDNRGKLRDECLNQNWFLTLKDARQVIEEWRLDMNTGHTALWAI